MSASGMDECEEKHSADTTRRHSVLERRNKKPREAGLVKARAEMRFLHDELG